MGGVAITIVKHFFLQRLSDRAIYCFSFDFLLPASHRITLHSFSCHDVYELNLFFNLKNLFKVDWVNNYAKVGIEQTIICYQRSRKILVLAMRGTLSQQK